MVYVNIPHRRNKVHECQAHTHKEKEDEEDEKDEEEVEEQEEAEEL